jgi:hypothetical protein
MQRLLFKKSIADVVGAGEPPANVGFLVGNTRAPSNPAKTIVNPALKI